MTNWQTMPVQFRPSILGVAETQPQCYLGWFRNPRLFLTCNEVPKSLQGISQSVMQRFTILYSGKDRGGTPRKNLRCRRQKRKLYSVGRDKRCQILHHRPLSDRPHYIEVRKQISNWGS
jgi:hypothetical protein